MPSQAITVVYADTCLLLSVIKKELPFWGPALQVLSAAHRRDIRLLLSTLVLAELAGVKGDVDPVEHDRVLNEYLLDNSDITWVDVDVSITLEARDVARRVPLKGGADATHLATAVRHRVDYFMSTDGEFPYGQRFDGVHVRRPEVVWTPTTDDLMIESEVAAEIQRADEEAAAAAAAKRAGPALERLRKRGTALRKP